MRVYTDTPADYHNTLTVAQYDSPRDMVRQSEKGVKRRGRRGFSTSSAGGTPDYLARGVRGQVTDYVDAAKGLIDKFANVAIEQHAVTLEQNMTTGMLDYSAAMAGDPMCMFGATIDRTDRSPVDIYVDPFVSGGVSASSIEKRGVAILALTQALSVYRPVNVYMVKGSKYSPKKANTVQIMPVPTQPMDLTRASFILCSPTVNRHGFFHAINEVHCHAKECPSFPMDGAAWQTECMGGWIAAQHGVTDYLFLRTMFTKGWTTEQEVVDWIETQLNKFIS